MKKKKQLVLILLAVFLLLVALYVIISRNGIKGGGDAESAGAFIVTDIDGNTYPCLKFGNQMWFIENLRTTRYNDGSPIEYLSSSADWSASESAACSFYNDASSGGDNPYGALYNWYAVESNRLCPTGWHVPDDSEWARLTAFLGGDSIAGAAMKSGARRYWVRKGRSANGTGFSAVPAGYRYIDGVFYDRGQNSTWWSSTGIAGAEAVARLVSRDGDYVYRIDYYHRRHGFSVRCVQDSSE